MRKMLKTNYTSVDYFACNYPGVPTQPSCEYQQENTTDHMFANYFHATTK